jgi:hypothetical protein
MRHLRSPGFAYSMPLDRAFTHLIATQRIEAYSVFPPIVVQTVDTRSDIQPDVRKVWQDECVRFGGARILADLLGQITRQHFKAAGAASVTLWRGLCILYILHSRYHAT